MNVLVAEAGALNLDSSLPNCKSLKQVILVAKPDSKHMDWSSTPMPKGVSVATWEDLISDSDATSEVPTVDHKDGSKPKPLGTFQLNTAGEMELSEFTSDVRLSPTFYSLPSLIPLSISSPIVPNLPVLTTPQNLISGISSTLTSYPRPHPLSPSDSLLPTTPLTTPYTLTHTLAALYSNASLALNSVSGPTVDLFASLTAFTPTILVTSPGTMSKYLINYSRTGLGPSRFAKFWQRRSLGQGSMPSRKPIPDLNSKDAMFLVMELNALSKVRAMFVGQDVAADVAPQQSVQAVTEAAAAAQKSGGGLKKTQPATKLKSEELGELRVDLGVRVAYALISGKVAGAVCQGNLGDYRVKEGKVVCVGPPTGSVEVKLRSVDGGDEAVDGKGRGPRGRVSRCFLLFVFTLVEFQVNGC